VSEYERRRAPRAHIALGCTLTRRVGSPIAATTVDIGSGGMSVATTRPLAVDEELAVDLPLHRAPRTSARARVVRDHGGDVYGLRFERLPEQMLADLDQLRATDSRLGAPDPRGIPKRAP
jgi:c-di-GMP-binding flagellar brake protein YcgR